jgi:pimeloyl-ACP methyl ester carboxylesterase
LRRIRNLKNKYESIDKIGLINAPLLILHGKLDDKIPVSHSRRLLEATQQGEAEAEAGEPQVGRKPPVTLVELEGGNHINNFQQPGWVVEMIKFYSSLS